MTNPILHPFDADREPELCAADIPWGVNGLAVGFVEDDDLASYRTLAHEAIHALARITAQLDRANILIIALHAELRRYVLTQMRDAA